MDRLLIAVIIAALAVALSIVNVDGEKCGTEPYECKYEDGCSSTTHKCECPAGQHGFPLFDCAGEGFALCQMVSDPIGQSFASQPSHPVKFALPCRFMMIDHYVTTQDYWHDQQLTCNIRVSAAQKRINGRMTIHGYETTISWTMVADNGMGRRGHFAFLQVGKLANGRYSYYSQTKYTIGGDWTDANFAQLISDLASSEVAIGWHESDTHMSILNIAPCGLEVLFRPSNQDDAFDSEYMPGISIKQSLATQDAGFTVGNNSPSGTFCHSVNIEDYNVTTAMEVSGADVIGQYMIDTMDSLSLQNFTDVSESCYTVYEKTDWMKVENKAQLLFAEKTCRFIFYEPEFVRCYAVGADSDNLVALFAECLDIFYQSPVPTNECRALRQKIDDAGCLKVSPPMNCVGVEEVTTPIPSGLKSARAVKSPKVRASPPGDQSVLD